MNPPGAAFRLDEPSEEIFLRKSQILIVDDEENYRKMLERILSRTKGYAISCARDADEALALLASQPIDLVLTDVKLPGINGLELVRQIHELKPDLPCIVITGFGGAANSVEALRAGAFWFLEKHFEHGDVDVVRRLVGQAIEHGRLKAENRILQNQLREKYGLENIIGKSEALQDVLDVVKKVADTDSTILITGESGTGKELIARAIHYKSSRADRILVTVNCGAIPEDLLESELFGHVKGAFTNAVSHREGRFAAADGGTIFLDEIGDMSPSLQVKLLRVLQERTFEPVGSSRSQTVDVRVIAATNQNLEEAIRKGRFREDLFYRLNVIPIEMPPLRERKEDIPLLIHHFLDKMNTEKGRSISGITPQAMALLTDYDWPGNVRELENLIERLCVLRDHGAIDVADLPKPFHRQAPTAEVLAPKLPLAGLDFREVVNRFESDLIQQALKRTKGNKNQAAQLLGLNRTTLLEKMKKKGLDAESDAADAETDTRSEAAPE